MKKKCITTFGIKQKLTSLLIMACMMPTSLHASYDGKATSISTKRLFEQEVQFAKELKKESKLYNSNCYQIEEWKDGTIKAIFYCKKDKRFAATYEMFYAVDWNTKEKMFSSVPVCDVKMEKIGDKDFYVGLHSSRKSLQRCDGKKLLDAVDDYMVKDCNGKPLIISQKFSTYYVYDIDGNKIFKPQNKPEWIAPVAKGETTIMVDGTPFIFYTNGEPGYFMDGYNVLDENGSNVKHEGLKDYRPFINNKTGLMWRNYDSSTKWIVTHSATNWGGKTVETKILQPIQDFTDRVYISMATPSGKVLFKDAFDVYYDSYEQSIHYKIFDGNSHRNLAGTYFLRDTTLNIPPMFSEVGYAKEGSVWKPYVRTSLFADPQPYIAGMDTIPRYANKGEREYEQNSPTSAMFYYTKLPKDHKWTIRELKGLNASVLQFVNTTSKSLLYEYLKSYTTGKYILQDVDESDFIKGLEETVENKYNISPYDDATSINEYAAKTSTNAQTREYAANAAKFIHEEKLKYINLVAACKEAKATHLRQKQMAAAQAEAARQQTIREMEKRQVQKAESEARQAAIIMQAVGNVLGNIFSNTSKRNGGTIYNGGASNTSTTTGNSTSSNLRTCIGCGGTGKCNACKNHPGLAVATGNKKCQRCHGDGLCPDCHGAGKRR